MTKQFVEAFDNHMNVTFGNGLRLSMHVEHGNRTIDVMVYFGDDKVTKQIFPERTKYSDNFIIHPDHLGCIATTVSGCRVDRHESYFIQRAPKHDLDRDLNDDNPMNY